MRQVCATMRVKSRCRSRLQGAGVGNDHPGAISLRWYRTAVKRNRLILRYFMVTPRNR